MIHVRQRADRYNAIGAPKSEAGQRTIPLPPLVVNTLKEWRLACPPGRLDLVFPNSAGNVESLEPGVLETDGGQEWTWDRAHGLDRIRDAYGPDAATEIATVLPV